MGLTCSLLGHDHGDPETERDREERGEEVVVVTREVRECRRCGDRTVVSENTEVRPVRSAESVGAADPEGEADPEADATPDSTADAEPPVQSAAEDDGVILEGEAERAPGEWPSAADTRAGDAPAEGVGERAPGEWPGAEDTAESATEVAGDAGDGGAVVEADAPEATEAADQGAAATESVADVTGREWPDEGPREDAREDADTGIAAAGSAGAAGGEDTVFVCPSCDFREPSAGSSLRSGDICPECQRGYLAERTRN